MTRAALSGATSFGGFWEPIAKGIPVGFVDHLLVKIKNPACRACPKGVGEAELTGTLCPFPGLLEDYWSSICGKELKLEKVGNNKALIKHGDWCRFPFTYKWQHVPARRAHVMWIAPPLATLD